MYKNNKIQDYIEKSNTMLIKEHTLTTKSYTVTITYKEDDKYYIFDGNNKS